MEEVIRKNNLFKYQSNNWLKMHGKVMRRKPFKRKRMYFDEFHQVFPFMIPYGDMIVTDPKGETLEKLKDKGYKIKVFSLNKKE